MHEFSKLQLTRNKGVNLSRVFENQNLSTFTAFKYGHKNQVWGDVLALKLLNEGLELCSEWLIQINQNLSSVTVVWL